MVNDCRLGDTWGILESACRGNLCWLFILGPRTVPNVSAYRPDYLFRSVTGVWVSHPNSSRKTEDLQDGPTDNGVGRRSQAELSLFEDIDSSIGGCCAVLSRDLVAHKRSLSFTYGRPDEQLKVLPSKLNWVLTTIEAFWENIGYLLIFSAFWNLT